MSELTRWKLKVTPDAILFEYAPDGDYVQYRDAKIALDTLCAENAALREAAQRLVDAVQDYQYSATPPLPLPTIAPAANALAELLAERGQ